MDGTAEKNRRHAMEYTDRKSRAVRIITTQFSIEIDAYVCTFRRYAFNTHSCKLRTYINGVLKENNNNNIAIYNYDTK